MAAEDSGSLQCRLPESSVLSGGEIKLMLLRRRQNTEVSLHPASVVVADVVLDHLDQLLLAGKPPAIIALPL